MKNVTISLSEDLVHVLDNICKDCDLSRYAFAKEALLEKIERHSKTESQEKAEVKPEDQKKNSKEPWRFF
jgi:predicted transcriptional regulator